MPGWTPEEIPDLAGRTVVVTGASSGIGLAAARHFNARGANVVAAVRDPHKAHAAMNFDADIRVLDLADLESIHAFASTLTGTVDILVNNAGVMAIPLARTAQGFEMQIGTNHLGHFALTGLLADRVTDRVVTVSSGAHRPGRIRLDDLNWQRGYRRWAAYAQSKLANLLFSRELQRRLTSVGSPVRAMSAHPGYADTALQGRTHRRLEDASMRLMNRTIAQSADQGSWPTAYASVADIPGDSFVGPDGLGELRGHPTLVGRSARAQDDEVALRLWELSEELTAVAYRFSISGG